MKKLSLCILAIIICAAVSAQPFRNFIGKETAQEYAYSVSQAADSSYIIGAKYTNTFLGTGFPAIAAVNKNGSVKWIKQVNISNLSSVYSTRAETVKTRSGTPDGSIMIIDVWKHFYAVRLRNDGSVIWARKFEQVNYFINNGLWIKPVYDANGSLTGFYILGNHYNQKGSFLIKTDVSGATVWQKKFVHPVATGDYWLKDMKVTADGGCVVTGSQGGTNVPALPVVFKINALGTVSWAKSYQLNIDRNCSAASICITSDGYAVTGSSASKNNLTFKIKNDGSFIWANFYSTADTKVSYTSGLSIAADTQGNLVIAGAADNAANNKPATLLKLSSTGSVIFTRRLAAETSSYEAFFSSIIVTSTGNYCMAGTSAGSNVTADIYIANFSSAGGSNVNCRPRLFVLISSASPMKTAASAAPLSSAESLSNTSIIATTFNITTAENYCGTTASRPEAGSSASLSIANDITGKRLLINFKTKNTGNYLAVLINNFGQPVTAVNIIPGQPAFISMGNMNNGIYTVAVKNEGNIAAQDKAVWVNK